MIKCRWCYIQQQKTHQQLANQEHAKDNPDKEVSEEEETIGRFADIQETKRTKTG